MTTTVISTLDLAHKLIAEQFPEFSDLPISDVEKQGHDNRTYRLGYHMLIRMLTAADYALKVPKEQELLPQLAKRLSFSIPAPFELCQIVDRHSPEARLQKRIIDEVMNG